MKKLLAVLASVVGISTAMAGDEPFQLSLTPDVAIYDRTDRIDGLTLSIWGENPQSSLAIGLVNGTTGNSVGHGRTRYRDENR